MNNFQARGDCIRSQIFYIFVSVLSAIGRAPRVQQENLALGIRQFLEFPDDLPTSMILDVARKVRKTRHISISAPFHGVHFRSAIRWMIHRVVDLGRYGYRRSRNS